MNTSNTATSSAHPALYYAAVEADEALTTALVAAYGKRGAAQMRYALTAHHSHRPEVVAALNRKLAADAAWLASMKKDRSE